MEWLDENRSDYDFAKDDILNMTQALIDSLAEFDLGIVSDKEIQSDLIKEKIVDYFKTVKPLVDFLNVAIEE